jgi:hypothetical protein
MFFRSNPFFRWIPNSVIIKDHLCVMGNISVLILLIYFLSDSSTFSPLWDKFNPNLLGSIKKLLNLYQLALLLTCTGCSKVYKLSYLRKNNKITACCPLFQYSRLRTWVSVRSSCTSWRRCSPPPPLPYTSSPLTKAPRATSLLGRVAPDLSWDLLRQISFGTCSARSLLGIVAPDLFWDL